MDEDQNKDVVEEQEETTLPTEEIETEEVETPAELEETPEGEEEVQA